jgi:two-component system, sensor histidine kinase and response regulator
MGGEVGVESEFGTGSTFWFSARLGVGTAAHRELTARLATGVAPKMETIRGARILLVEDNEINQQVARELLEDAGLVVEVADHGEAALAMVRQAAYDLVFMDMQMPVMDGVTATREIRKLVQLAGLPIVAMTANAMAQDLRRCIDAGMNDYVVKPIDPDQMWAVLLRWVKPQAATSRVAAIAAPQTSAAAGELPVGIPGLDTALGLSRMMGKKKLYVAMLARFVEGHRSVPAQIAAALAADDFTTAERLAHTARGVGGNIGATALQGVAGELEQALKDGVRGDALALLLQDFDTRLTRLVDALAESLRAA